MPSIAYNVTLNAQAANLLFLPARDGLMQNGWNTSYSAIPDSGFAYGVKGIGDPSRRTVLPGASIWTDWIGTAAYIYGDPGSANYSVSIDDEAQDISSLGDGGGILAKLEELENQNHTLAITVGKIEDADDPFIFKGIIFTVLFQHTAYVNLLKTRALCHIV